MRLKLISCEIFEREVRFAAAQSSNHIDVHLLKKAPHQMVPGEMVNCFQGIIDQSDRASYHGVLLVIGGCKPGLQGLQARSIPVVMPRARDCISLVLEKPAPEIKSRSGQSNSDPHARRPAWASPDSARLAGMGFADSPVASVSPRQSVLLNELGWRGRVGFCAVNFPVKGCRARSRSSLLHLLVDGFWNYNDFLVVPPGWRVVANQDQGSIAAEESPL